MPSNDANDVSSLYPPPPPYIKFFTQQNVDKLEKYKEEKQLTEANDENDPTVVEGDSEEVFTNELDYLIPPKMPKSHQYLSLIHI